MEDDCLPDMVEMIGGGRFGSDGGKISHLKKSDPLCIGWADRINQFFFSLILNFHVSKLINSFPKHFFEHFLYYGAVQAKQSSYFKNIASLGKRSLCSTKKKKKKIQALFAAVVQICFQYFEFNP